MIMDGRATVNGKIAELERADPGKDELPRQLSERK
jgi:hypothetical protein